MKILIAIKTCHRYHERAEAQRATWVQRVAEAVPPGWTVDMRFFIGRCSGGVHAVAATLGTAPLQDTIMLDCDDSYNGLTEKTREIFRWALARGYDHVFSSDDDVYIVPERLFSGLVAGGHEGRPYDYIGRLRGPSGGFAAPYASGFAVWTSHRAMVALAEASIDRHRAQDRWIGNVLYAAGFQCHRDSRFVVAASRRNTPCAREGARQGNDVIAACEFWPADMLREHAAFLNGAAARSKTTSLPEDAPFSRVAVMIKTFLRDGYLFNTVRAIEARLPGMKMVIIDDGRSSRDKIRLYPQLERRGHVCHCLAFDSGFGAKSNAAVERIGDREYTLIGCDDFDFAGPGVPEGIQKMISVLDHDPEVGSVGGRVNNKAYEGFTIRSGDTVREVLLDPEKCEYRRTQDGVPYAIVDLTVNYNLVRTKLLGEGRIVWNEEFKIGGDHYAFYHQMREMEMKVAWVPGVNINEQRATQMGMADREYGKYRGRARLATPSFLRRHGLKSFEGFYGNIDRLPEGA